MGAKKKAAKAGAAAAAVRKSPYVQRIAEDEELRANLWNAYESARDAVGRLQNGKHPTKQIFDDKKLQKDIKSAAESFKEASVALREAPKKKRKGGVGKLLLLGIVSAGVALAVSEDLRKKVLDALFGAEEEFEYTSTTAPRVGAGGRRLDELTPAAARAGPHRRAPQGRPSSFYSAMKSRTSTSAPGRASVSEP